MPPNSEVECERSSTKYDRAKNKLNPTMKSPMIKTRMGVGSNSASLDSFTVLVKFLEFDLSKIFSTCEFKKTL